MRVLKADVEAAFTTTEAGVPVQVAVTIPQPFPSPGMPETLTVSAAVIGDHVVLYPERSYRHRELARALGV